MKKISILMPVHNEEEFIEQSISSVIEQDFEDFELIIIDDGSTDRTWELIQKYQSKKIIAHNFGKIGKNAAFNKAFELSNGEWIIFFAGDDKMAPNSLIKRYCAVKKFDSSKKVVGYSRLETISEDKKFHGMKLPKNSKKGLSSGGTVIFSRGYAECIFPIPVNYPNEDIWTALHFNNFKGVHIHIPVTTTIYRIHPGNSMKRTTSFSITNQNLHERYLIYEEFINQYTDELEPKQLRKLRSLAEGENLRYMGKTLSLLLLKDIPVA